MHKLPIHEVLPEIKNTLKSHNRVVLQAAPGAGKTTAVPIALLDQPWLQGKQIIILEPRRLAARNAAARMAFLLNEKVGQTVGYQIRQDNCYSKKTRILVVTEGILTRKLQADPELENTALVIFDEFHERSLHADLSLALCLQSQQILREDLKILIMSATLNTRSISELLNNAPIISSKGRSFPIDIHYAEKQLQQSAQNRQLQLISGLFNLVEKVIHSHEANCLVFLPGVKEINQLCSQIKHYLKTENIKHIFVATLHGSLNKQEQNQAISAPPDNMRKIVLATNIAETSLTIEGINCVIDSGLERVSDYNPSSGMNRLKTQFISQDSAEQRSGRAGRLSAGNCYRLWTTQQQQRLTKHALAEILHSDLSNLILELANWGILQVDELQWLDIPPASSVAQAKQLLQQLHGLNNDGKITPHGKDMLRLGTHPRLAHMMLSANKLNRGYHACLIASMLTEKEFYRYNAPKSADIQDRLSILQSLPGNNNKKSQQQDIDNQQCKRIIKTADEFFKRLRKKETGTDQDKSLDNHFSGILLAYAYPDRIAKQRHKNASRYLLSNGKGAEIPQHLQQHAAEFLVIANLNAKQNTISRGEASIYLAAEISQQQLEDYFPEQIQQTETVQWNNSQQRVEAKQTTNIGKIILQETLVTTEKKQEIQQCLLQAIKTIGLQSFNWTAEATNLKQRLQFINYQINNHASNKVLSEIKLSDFSDSTLLNTLSEWLQPYLNNENSIKHCLKLDMHKLLSNQLSWQQQKLIDKLAPEKITVPSGSGIRIDYSDPLTPVLAVRLQEVFGLYETPTILNDHCKLMMHLLSPARRPMQVTQDLHSFWQTTYHEVKKELRGKYKRHYWPDDPLTAQATSKTKKRMNR
ncbi:ATP-dependent helicase HrpB [Cardiobacterium sp. AH-315-I02]|nr:ATP-dependent helicase HrpB [Cardiobacterium sp. AH-315-I02]